MITTIVRNVGRKTLDFLQEFGQVVQLFVEILKSTPHIFKNRRNFFYQMEHIGVNSIPLVFIIPILLLIILYFGKKNKPNGFLVHLIRFYITAGFYSAGQDSKYLNNLKEKIYEE